MIGLILCGGQSSRMGCDKGLLYKENISWVQLAVNNCIALDLATYISIRGEQLNSYGHLYPSENFIQDKSDLGFQGPLIGIMSAHASFPTEDLLVLACDMIEMQKPTLSALIQMRVSNPSYQAYCYSNQDNLEPLVAIYTAEGLAKIHSLYQRNALAKQSMKYVLHLLHTFSIAIQSTQLNSFQNFNAPNDLIRR